MSQITGAGVLLSAPKKRMLLYRFARLDPELLEIVSKNTESKTEP